MAARVSLLFVPLAAVGFAAVHDRPSPPRAPDSVDECAGIRSRPPATVDGCWVLESFVAGAGVVDPADTMQGALVRTDGIRVLVRFADGAVGCFTRVGPALVGAVRGDGAPPDGLVAYRPTRCDPR